MSLHHFITAATPSKCLAQGSSFWSQETSFSPQVDYFDCTWQPDTLPHVYVACPASSAWKHNHHSTHCPHLYVFFNMEYNISAGTLDLGKCWVMTHLLRARGEARWDGSAGHPGKCSPSFQCFIWSQGANGFPTQSTGQSPPPWNPGLDTCGPSQVALLLLTDPFYSLKCCLLNYKCLEEKACDTYYQDYHACV